MKKFLLISLLGLIVITQNSFAQDNNAEISQSQTTRLNISSDNPNRPRTIAASWIDCHYSKGQLTLYANGLSGSAEVYIIKETTGATEYYYVPVLGQTTYMNLESGTYYIICELFGCIYEGILYIS